MSPFTQQQLTVHLELDGPFSLRGNTSWFVSDAPAAAAAALAAAAAAAAGAETIPQGKFSTSIPRLFHFEVVLPSFPHSCF